MLRPISVLATLASLWALSFGFASEVAVQMQPPAPNPSPIRVVPVRPTPEGDRVTVYIMFPSEGELIDKTKVNVQIRMEGFPLGTKSDFPRAKEIYNSKIGQSLHIFIDNQPYFVENNSIIDAFYDNQLYYNLTVTFQIPFSLKPGMHVMRVFPARSFGESLKGDKCYKALVFYYKSKKNDYTFDANAPCLTYNEPQGQIPYDADTPILLDFYLANCELSRDGYKVRLSVDGTVQRILMLWVPYYVYGLSKGTHHIRLELLDRNNDPVPGPFNDVQREIILK